jgi:glutamate-1-semialdehyde 2,1-aminomutase
MRITYESSLEGFSETFKVSKALAEEAKSRIPGAHSRHFSSFGPHAIFIDHGEGQYLYTVDGHRLLDLNNNFTVNVLGHNHPSITQALYEAIPHGYSFGNPMRYEGRLAERICERVASVEKIKFTCSASEACISAVRIARAHTGKNKIARFEGGYHGFIDDLQISAHPDPARFPGPAYRPTPLPDSAGITPQTVANTVVLTQNDFSSCEKILKENRHDIACLIMELQSQAGGVVVLDKQFVADLRALTKQLGIVMIVDETITLRADYHGMQGVYGIEPDLTVMGKMIGGGLPIGAVGGKAEFFTMVENNQVQTSGTHHGHPLAAAAGIACLEVMDDAAYRRLNSMAERIKSEVNAWAEERAYRFVVYGAHSALGYAFVDEVGREVRTHRDYWHHVDGRKVLIFALEMATRGFFPVHRGELSLSLPTTDEDIGDFIAITKEIVAAILEA